MNDDLYAVLGVAVLAALAPLLMSGLARWVKIPLVVFEIALGIVVGPPLLGWIPPSELVQTAANLGLVMLFFLAGNEIDVARIAGRPLRRAGLGWVVSLAGALVVALVAVTVVPAPSNAAIVYIAIALTSTALGTLMPVLRDAGELTTPFGTAVLAIGAAGEFGPLIAISIFLSGREPGPATVVLLFFVVIAAAALFLAARGPHRRLHRIISGTLHTSGQFAVRLVMVLVFALVGLSLWLDLDMLLGAFVAGALTRVLLSSADPKDREVIESKLDGLGFGFVVPFFFITTGLTFDLSSLLSSPAALVLLPIFLVMLLVVRGLTGLFNRPRGAGGADTRALVLFTATGLPIIVAVTGIGVEAGDLPVPVATALVGAGMLSVLLFPLIALAQRPAAAAPAAVGPGETDEVPDEG